MLRNREIRLLLMAAGLISAASVVFAYLISPYAAALLFVQTLLLTACCYLFTRRRYRDIAKLSGYLRRIGGGDYTLDVRDNEEGELSILKNDIYKMTMMLSEQRSLLQQEKVRLTAAISDISHQLKTPLTSMMVMADVLGDPGLSEDKRSEFTRNIRIQLERIDWLVSTLLKLSKIDAGTVVFKQERIEVAKLVQKAVEPVLIPVDIKGQTILIDGDDDAEFTGDLNWTAEALINILKNGVEHTPEGGAITISYSENVLYTEICISDTGKGIAKEDLPYIFKRFYRGRHASEESAGIGLALAHSIVTGQNGIIEVKSEQGDGTRFALKFYKQVV